MATRNRRAKNEPSKGDLLAQAYRNRAAMFRVYEQSTLSHKPIEYRSKIYWTPVDIRTMNL